MITDKRMDKICVTAIIISLLLAVIVMKSRALGGTNPEQTIGYENRLFDNSKVHTIDIVMDDFDEFIKNASGKEYSACTLVIDQEVFRNVGIRGKGNYSMRVVSMSGSDRHSFKVEFDHYNDAGNYHGLDKLSLNNINQDNTYMKDYLSYELMRQEGVPAPLCSYVYLTVNGKEWGLYLATEGIEEAFLSRNYGNSSGKLYKPDTSAGGGGREDWKQWTDEDGNPIDMENFDWEQFEQEHPDWQEERAKFWGMDAGGNQTGNEETWQYGQETSDHQGWGQGAGMSTDDVKLKYLGNDPDSYPAIFDNAKSGLTNADKKRLIEAIRILNQESDIEETINVDEVIRYFAVHNFLCNDDSYTGPLVHNYYLYEENRKLSMIPWDYNLAFATFGEADATERVNTPIDTPIVDGTNEDRPMFSWIIKDQRYKEIYHDRMKRFADDCDISGMIDQTKSMISSYVERDPTKFCSYQEFEEGVLTLKRFCELRLMSIQGQLEGYIPSTTDGQKADPSKLIDAKELDLTKMGVMDSSGFGGYGAAQ